jgi:hypothetical protein
MGDASGGDTKPTSAQLEKLLGNDVSSIRALAVDWFRISPPSNAADRQRFLIAALRTNPRQVSDRAARACDSETVQSVRDACTAAKPKPTEDAP